MKDFGYDISDYRAIEPMFGTMDDFKTLFSKAHDRHLKPWSATSHRAGFTTAKEPWLPIPPEHLDIAVDLQEQNSMSLLNKYRRLFRWRKQQPAFLKGDLKLLDTPEPLLGFSRKCDEQHLICLFNLSPIPLHYDLSDYSQCTEAEESGFSNRRYDNTVEISAYGVFFGNCA